MIQVGDRVAFSTGIDEPNYGVVKAVNGETVLVDFEDEDEPIEVYSMFLHKVDSNNNLIK